MTRECLSVTRLSTPALEIPEQPGDQEHEQEHGGPVHAAEGHHGPQGLPSVERSGIRTPDGRGFGTLAGSR